MVIERHWLRWPAAALIFAATTWLNLQLQPMLDGRAPLLPYFPALVIVGLAFGLGPALAVVITGSLAILYFWIEPVGHFFPINTLADAVLVALFLVTGSLALGLVALRFGLWPGVAIGLAMVAVGTLACGHWFRRRLGGITGDTLGATQQLTELLCLLGWVLALRWA